MNRPSKFLLIETFLWKGEYTKILNSQNYLFYCKKPTNMFFKKSKNFFMDRSEMLVPANRAGQIRPKSSSLFLLTQPGHNNNFYNSSINKISSTSYYKSLFLFSYSVDVSDNKDPSSTQIFTINKVSSLSILFLEM